MRTLLIDNYDSYTYNLYQLIAETYGTPPHVVRNDDPELTCDLAREFDAVVVSPGPGRPQTPGDVGRGLRVVRDGDRPVLGVCLGHQLLGHLSGAAVGPAPDPRHGHLTRVRHLDDGLFAGLPQDFVAVRYHSLAIATPLPPELTTDAWAEDGVIMGVRHRLRPWFGVQFHPESVATEHGAQLLRNFRALVTGEPGERPRPAGRPSRCAGRTTRPVAARARATGGAKAGASVPADGGWRLCYRRLPFAADPEQTFRDHFAGRPYAFWLDSSHVVPGLSRFSFLGFPGGPHGEVLGYRVGAGKVRVLDAAGRHVNDEPGDVFEALQQRLDRRRLTVAPDLPFDLQGGYVGYFGYELKGDCGSPNPHPAPTADAVWMAATRFVAVDHRADTTWVVALCRQDADPEADAWLAETAAGLRPAQPAPPIAAAAHAPTDLEPWLVRPRAGYLADIQVCLDRLRAGESYEVCLTNEVRMPFDADPLERYLRQRRLNPAPYAAYLRLGDTHVLCSSPERFLKLDRHGWVEAKPIKGTAPRDADPERDRELSRRLATSAKTRAENLMIVDLLRNDLGRVCQIGSVHVPSFLAVESYATVHQLVSTIRARRRAGVGAVEIVRACFPGGSMTGAPKLRTMRIIGELEGRPRGIYSGALGFLSLTGTADLNIVIRTAVVHDGRLHVGAGGAIVLDSDPEAEYEEMLLKARAALRGLVGRA
ncbi:MAG TPA: aminodeoxychorismate synthase component I [Micromonosporaceae bacterium]